MKIHKSLEPVVGVFTGCFLFLAGIAVTSVMFALTYKAVAMAKPYVLHAFASFHNFLHQI